MSFTVTWPHITMNNWLLYGFAVNVFFLAPFPHHSRQSLLPRPNGPQPQALRCYVLLLRGRSQANMADWTLSPHCSMSWHSTIYTKDLFSSTKHREKKKTESIGSKSGEQQTGGTWYVQPQKQSPKPKLKGKKSFKLLYTKSPLGAQKLTPQSRVGIHPDARIHTEML